MARSSTRCRCSQLTNCTEKYDSLFIYVLTERQGSYSEDRCREIVQGRFDFNPDRDILDYRDVLKIIGNLEDRQDALESRTFLKPTLERTRYFKVSLVTLLYRRNLSMNTSRKRSIFFARLDTSPSSMKLIMPLYSGQGFRKVNFEMALTL